MLEHDPVLFHKWFGTVNDGGYSDEQVRHRIQRAYDFLYEEEPRWDVMCCDQAIGGCDMCATPGMLAYVVHYMFSDTQDGVKTTYIDSQHNQTHIRLCPAAFALENTEEAMGIIMYHEIIHMVTHAVSHCYAKDDCYNLAQTQPEKARLNANSYTLHAVEGGADREDYNKYTKSWGLSIVNNQCSDLFSSCYDFIKPYDCNAPRIGSILRQYCCASCHYQQGTDPVAP